MQGVQEKDRQLYSWYIYCMFLCPAELGQRDLSNISSEWECTAQNIRR